ncbi:sensor histidine kinase [Oceanospirillum sediminis]|uniref:histidine kinase n=1 Tax=Oceanospirillum sediminis TaxID=2760088 RepID=A0A839IYB4_9GAMM|nr:sensor histidine kinase [Oceanospirillum sediminis]MBB1489584.1 sensor histidine kinase [Oceanospirillum sediminis]
MITISITVFSFITAFRSYFVVYFNLTELHDSVFFSHFSQVITATIRHTLKLLCAVLLCIAPDLYAKNPIIYLDGTQDSISLAGHMKWRTDNKASLTIQDISSVSEAHHFKDLAAFLNLGYTNKASWVTFNYKTPDNSQDDYYLLLSPYILNKVDVYIRPLADNFSVYTDQPAWQTFNTGDHRASGNRPYLTPEMIIPLPRIQSTEYQVFIRTQTTSSHNLRGWIVTEKGVINSSASTLIWVSAFIACTLILGTIALLQAARLNSGIQLWYGLYLFSEGLSQIGAQGILPVIIPEYAHYISDWLTGGASALAYISMSSIIILVLNTRQEHPWLHKYLLLIITIGLATLLLAGTAYYNQLIPWMARLGLILMPLTTLIYYQKFNRTDSAQRLFFLFFASCTLVVFVHILRLLGIVPINTLTNASIMINTVVHMILLNMALSEKLLQAEQQARTAAEESEAKAITLANEMTHELRQSKQQLESSLEKEQNTLQEQNRFIDMISHEYRTPLAIIKTNLDILELKSQPDWYGANHLKTMAQAILRLQEIFNTELNKGKWHYDINPDMARLNARNMTDSILSDARMLWSNAPLIINNQLPGQAVMQADPALIKTVIFNLVDNALKYSVKDSHIYCQAEQRGKDCVIKIINAISAPDELDLTALRKKYYRGGNSSGTTGLGMGLYLISQIIEQHQGCFEIHISNQAEFIVSVTLPMLQEQICTPSRNKSFPDQKQSSTPVDG